MTTLVSVCSEALKVQTTDSWALLQRCYPFAMAAAAWRGAGALLARPGAVAARGAGSGAREVLASPGSLSIARGAAARGSRRGHGISAAAAPPQQEEVAREAPPRIDVSNNCVTPVFRSSPQAPEVGRGPAAFWGSVVKRKPGTEQSELAALPL